MSYPASPQADPGSSNSKPILITAIAIGAAAVIGIGVLIFTMGIGSEPSASPTEVVQKFSDLQTEGKFDESFELWTEEGAENYREKQWHGKTEPTESDKAAIAASTVEISDERIDDSHEKATVKLTEKSESETVDVEISLVIQDGEWRMADFSRI